MLFHKLIRSSLLAPWRSWRARWEALWRHTGHTARRWEGHASRRRACSAWWRERWERHVGRAAGHVWRREWRHTVRRHGARAWGHAVGRRERRHVWWHVGCCSCQPGASVDWGVYVRPRRPFCMNGGGMPGIPKRSQHPLRPLFSHRNIPGGGKPGIPIPIGPPMGGPPMPTGGPMPAIGPPANWPLRLAWYRGFA